MSTIQLVHITLEIWGAVFCLIIGAVIYAEKQTEHTSDRMLLMLILTDMLLLISDTVAWTFRGTMTMPGFYMVRVSNFLVFTFSFVIEIIAAEYLSSLISENNGKENRAFNRAINIIAVIEFIALVISRFNNTIYTFDSHNRYYRTKYYTVFTVAWIMIMSLMVTNVVKNRKTLGKKRYSGLMCYCIAPGAAVIVQLFHYGISILNIFITLAVFMIFVFHEAERAKREQIQAQKLNDMQVELLKSQIQPHFLFNSLTAIQTLIAKDPGEAYEAVGDFADFMHGTMNALTSDKLISIEEEMRTTDGYLAMEKRRFGDGLIIETDIADRDFVLPALTIQPIAENAVRHGIRGKNAPGVLTIKTQKDTAGHMHVITVRDDGIGFDPETVCSDGGTHVGIENVRRRVELMCGGTLEIMSSCGCGTTVKITIPVKRGGE
jgi:two-component system LytT family sensor kinase